MFSSVGKMHISTIFEIRSWDQSLLTIIFLKLFECPQVQASEPLGSAPDYTNSLSTFFYQRQKQETHL